MTSQLSFSQTLNPIANQFNEAYYDILDIVSLAQTQISTNAVPSSIVNRLINDTIAFSPYFNDPAVTFQMPAIGGTWGTFIASVYQVLVGIGNVWTLFEKLITAYNVIAGNIPTWGVPYTQLVQTAASTLPPNATLINASNVLNTFFISYISKMNLQFIENPNITEADTVMYDRVIRAIQWLFLIGPNTSVFRNVGIDAFLGYNPLIFDLQTTMLTANVASPYGALVFTPGVPVSFDGNLNGQAPLTYNSQGENISIIIANNGAFNANAAPAILGQANTTSNPATLTSWYTITLTVSDVQTGGLPGNDILSYAVTSATGTVLTTFTFSPPWAVSQTQSKIIQYTPATPLNLITAQPTVFVNVAASRKITVGFDVTLGFVRDQITNFTAINALKYIDVNGNTVFLNNNATWDSIYNAMTGVPSGPLDNNALAIISDWIYSDDNDYARAVSDWFYSNPNIQVKWSTLTGLPAGSILSYLANPSSWFVFNLAIQNQGLTYATFWNNLHEDLIGFKLWLATITGVGICKETRAFSYI